MRLLNLRAYARGVSLIELAVVLTIVSILAVMAAPGLADYMANSRLRESGNAVLVQTMFARSEAIKRNTNVRLTVNGAAISVEDIRDPGSPVELRTLTLANGVTGSTATVRFNSEGRSVDSTGVLASASVDFSIASATCSTEIRCPGLRVDGGGDARLCGDRLNCS
jgi:type IV fimbrial biogenesis protein FimT